MVAVISGQTNKIIGTDSFDSTPGPITFGPKTGDVYVSTGETFVTGANSQAITVISGQTNKIISNIAFPVCVPAVLINGQQFTFSPRTGDLYIPLTSGSGCRTYSLQVVSGQTNKIIGAVPLAAPGQQIAADPVTGDVYVLRPQSAQGNVGPYVASVIAG
jgi:DNA-binding beta-propeller fold protein YncE